jgi:hypothetical protein
MDLFKNPLSEVAHRKSIAKAVQKGRAVENSADALFAVAYAHWVARLWGWLAVVFGAVGAINIYLATASTSQRFDLILGIAFVGIGVAYGWMRSRALRSVPLNQGIP